MCPKTPQRLSNHFPIRSAEFIPSREIRAEGRDGSILIFPLAHFLFLGELYLFKSRVPNPSRSFRGTGLDTPPRQPQPTHRARRLLSHS